MMPTQSTMTDAIITALFNLGSIVKECRVTACPASLTAEGALITLFVNNVDPHLGW